MPSVFGRIAAAHQICGQLIRAVDLLPARNPNHIRFRLSFTDGSRLQVSEEWRRGELGAYSYYWLDAHDALIQGWDNAPHHRSVSTFPHHRHDARGNVHSALPVSVSDVLGTILPLL